MNRDRILQDLHNLSDRINELRFQDGVKDSSIKQHSTFDFDKWGVDDLEFIGEVAWFGVDGDEHCECYAMTNDPNRRLL